MDYGLIFIIAFGIFALGIFYFIDTKIAEANCSAEARLQASTYRKINPNSCAYIGFSVFDFAVAGFLIGIALTNCTPVNYSSAIILGSFALPYIYWCVSCYRMATRGVADIKWDVNGIFGRVTLRSALFGPRHKCMRFEDMIEADFTVRHGPFVGDKAGHKIQWNRYYSGFSTLEELLLEKRPDLFPPEALDAFRRSKLA